MKGYKNSNTITRKINSTAPNSEIRDKLVARKQEEDDLKNTYSVMRGEIETAIDEFRQHTTEQINLANQEIANLENKLKDPSIGGTRKRRKYKKRH
jgi:gas vesicle protein